MEEMKPGHELDIVIAEKVMGLREELLKANSQNAYENIRRKIDSCPEYSTKIEAAWEVVEKFHKESNGNAVSITMYSSRNSLGETWENQQGFRVEFLNGNNGPPYVSHSNSLPHAICKAALAALKEAEK